MGHINFDNLIKISKEQAARDIPKITKSVQFVCQHCLHGKQTRVSFKTKEYSEMKPLELFHTDLCGPMRTKGINVELYFLLFIHDYTQITWVFFLKKK